MRTFDKSLAVVVMAVVVGAAVASSETVDGAVIGGGARATPDPYPVLPTYEAKLAQAQRAADLALLGASTSQTVSLMADRDTGIRQTEASNAADRALQARKDAAMRGTPVKPATGDARGGAVSSNGGASYYLQNMDWIEAGIDSDEERRFLRENVHSPETLAWARRQLELRRRADQVYADAGPVTTFFAKTAARLLDPLTWVLLAVPAFFLVRLIRKKGDGTKADLSQRREPGLGLPPKREGQKV